jgi:ureidoglycolate lyase
MGVLTMQASHRALRVERLTAEAFAQFGDVIEARDAKRCLTINRGRAERFHDLAFIDATEGRGRPAISLVRSQPSPLPIRLTLLERHLLSSQAFIALPPAAFLVVVAPTGAVPITDRIRCFLPAPGQGVNYARGTWHHPLLALNSTADFLVVDRAAPDGEVDCEEWSIGETIWVEDLCT